jgi:hypothetical protein
MILGVLLAMYRTKKEILNRILFSILFFWLNNANTLIVIDSFYLILLIIRLSLSPPGEGLTGLFYNILLVSDNFENKYSNSMLKINLCGSKKTIDFKRTEYLYNIIITIYKLLLI